MSYFKYLLWEVYLSRKVSSVGSVVPSGQIQWIVTGSLIFPRNSLVLLDMVYSPCGVVSKTVSEFGSEATIRFIITSMRSKARLTRKV